MLTIYLHNYFKLGTNDRSETTENGNIKWNDRSDVSKNYYIKDNLIKKMILNRSEEKAKTIILNRT